jgi:hypothetical protein
MKHIRYLPLAWFFRARPFVFGVLIMAATFSFCEQAKAATTPVIGWIAIKSSPNRADQIIIQSRIQGLKTTNGDFQIRVTRNGRSGKSASNQSGAFRVKSGETGVLATTTINLQAEDRLEIVLTLFEDGKKIFSVRAQTP